MKRLKDKVALITGAASGIGKACAEAFLQRGAAVIALDIDPSIETALRHPAYLGLRCDVSRENELSDALEAGARHFGGLDMLILNAGIFPPSRRLDVLDNRLNHVFHLREVVDRRRETQALNRCVAILARQRALLDELRE